MVAGLAYMYGNIPPPCAKLYTLKLIKSNCYSSDLCLYFKNPLSSNSNQDTKPYVTFATLNPANPAEQTTFLFLSTVNNDVTPSVATGMSKQL